MRGSWSSVKGQGGYISRSEILRKTLQEAQRTQIINSVTRVISMAETNYTYFNFRKWRHLMAKFANNASFALW